MQGAGEMVGGERECLHVRQRGGGGGGRCVCVVCVCV